jgi:hypothetical protein
MITEEIKKNDFSVSHNYLYWVRFFKCVRTWFMSSVYHNVNKSKQNVVMQGLSRKSPVFMEPGSSITWSQNFTTELNPEPVESNSVISKIIKIHFQFSCHIRLGTLSEYAFQVSYSASTCTSHFLHVAICPACPFLRVFNIILIKIIILVVTIIYLAKNTTCSSSLFSPDYFSISRIMPSGLSRLKLTSDTKNLFHLVGLNCVLCLLCRQKNREIFTSRTGFEPVISMFECFMNTGLQASGPLVSVLFIIIITSFALLLTVVLTYLCLPLNTSVI